MAVLCGPVLKRSAVTVLVDMDCLLEGSDSPNEKDAEEWFKRIVLSMSNVLNL